MGRVQFSILALSISVFSFTQMSFAQELPEGSPGVSTEVTPAENKKSAFPTALLARPFTLPAGTAEIGGRMKLGVHQDAAGKTAPDLVSLNSLSLGVGVTDDLQLGLSWGGFQIPNVKPAQGIDINAGYFLFANKWAAAMASLNVPFHFNSDVVNNVTFAMPTAFGVVQNVSILAFYDSLIDFGFGKKDGNRKLNASFSLPIKLGYQATPNLWVDVSTRLAKFEVQTGKDHSYFWKSAPIKVRGFYAITNAFDVVADAGFDDVFNAKDTFAVVLGIQYRMGNLDG